MDVDQKILEMQDELNGDDRDDTLDIPMGLFAALKTERPELLDLWIRTEEQAGSDLRLLAIIKMLTMHTFEDRKRLRAVVVANDHLTTHIKGLHTLGEVMSRIATDDLPREIHSPSEVVSHFKAKEKEVSG